MFVRMFSGVLISVVMFISRNDFVMVLVRLFFGVLGVGVILVKSDIDRLFIFSESVVYRIYVSYIRLKVMVVSDSVSVILLMLWWWVCKCVLIFLELVWMVGMEDVCMVLGFIVLGRLCWFIFDFCFFVGVEVVIWRLLV